MKYSLYDDFEPQMIKKRTTAKKTIHTDCKYSSELYSEENIMTTHATTSHKTWKIDYMAKFTGLSMCI